MSPLSHPLAPPFSLSSKGFEPQILQGASRLINSPPFLHSNLPPPPPFLPPFSPLAPPFFSFIEGFEPQILQGASRLINSPPFLHSNLPPPPPFLPPFSPLAPPFFSFIEGFEPQILQGASRLIKLGRIRVIKTEVAPRWLIAQGSSSREFCELLERLGYSLGALLVLTHPRPSPNTNPTLLLT